MSKSLKVESVLEAYKQAVRVDHRIEFQGLCLRDFPLKANLAAFPGVEVQGLSAPVWATLLLVDAEGRLYTGKRKGPGRHDSGYICDIAPLAFGVAMLGLRGGTAGYPFYNKEIRVIHLKAAESWEAVFAAASKEIAALAPMVDPEVVERLRADAIRRSAFNAELKAKQEKAEAMRVENLETCRKWWQEEGLKSPHVRMLLAQPKKGFHWQIKFRDFIEAEILKRFSWTPYQTMDFAREVVKALNP